MIEQSTGKHTEEWTPVYGERSRIPDHYNRLIVTLKADHGRLLSLEFRVYNEGVSFRYTLPEQAGLENFIITAERSQFHFP
jgi:hypothetical protein